MDPMAPDWRTIGQPPTPATGKPAAGSARAAMGTLHVAWIAGACLALLVLGAMLVLLLMPTPGGVLIDLHQADSGRAGPIDGTGSVDVDVVGAPVAADPDPLVVDVEGAVARPGLVEVPVGGRVGDALLLAGGFAANADLTAAAEALNLALEVVDGAKIVVPAIGDVSSNGSSATTDDRSAGDPVDLNLASESELDTLPGVGPATIAKIVAAREEAPFRGVDELRSRGVVGAATFAKLRDLVTVGR
jgi:competence protein ComEA